MRRIMMVSSNGIDFSLYIAILGQSAMMQLGKIMNPATGKLEKDLVQAKFTIDVLGIIEKKTEGNLTKEESELLKSTLTNLRLNYVEEVREMQEKDKKSGKSSGKSEDNKEPKEPDKNKDTAKNDKKDKKE
ncbi:MAG: DUF1844 domain-containing protein [Spirochaetes bacterium]|nr:DUF1844 domain-containing protein [Spirochaetota bacterium]